jgi:hypothetical protein
MLSRANVTERLKNFLFQRYRRWLGDGYLPPELSSLNNAGFLFSRRGRAFCSL